MKLKCIYEDIYTCAYSVHNSANVEIIEKVYTHCFHSSAFGRKLQFHVDTSVN